MLVFPQQKPVLMTHIHAACFVPTQTVCLNITYIRVPGELICQNYLQTVVAGLADIPRNVVDLKIKKGTEILQGTK